MKTKSVRSQITMLMLVGLVLFIVVSFVLYLSKLSVKKQSKENIGKSQEIEIDKPIKELVSKCLDKLAKDSIILLGKQGGYIYKSQGGTIVDYTETDEGVFFVKYDNLNVAYNILPTSFAATPYSSGIPDYPWPTFPYKTASSNEEVFEGFFGINTMPPLNSSEGPNSIQNQIESFIDYNIASCINFDFFETYGYSITANSSTTSVLIGTSDISINSKIPITISHVITKESAKISEFSTTINVRLKDIYLFTKELIENDIRNIKFSIRSQNNNKNSLDIQLFENAFSKDDLIIITDGKSLIYGKPFEYIFARRNRAPALYYIKQNILEFPHLYTITQNDLLQGYELKAEDPDEDESTFIITPKLPKVLNIPQINFKVEITDGKSSDYQVITVNRI